MISLLYAAFVFSGMLACNVAAAPTRTSGMIAKVTENRVAVHDDAGHLEEFVVDAKTKVTCDGKIASFLKATASGRCARAERVLYDGTTKRVSRLDLKTVAKTKKGADDLKAAPTVTGEIALTDVMGGKITVRLGGGANIVFMIQEATQILRESDGKPPVVIPFESLKIGERVEIHSTDWKTADEIRVGPSR